MSSIIVIAGPTASGKTALGVSLAQHLNGEVISCDSMQIYADIPICSAAPTKEEMCSIPHHLIGFVPFNQKFTVVDYRNAATEKIKDILSRNKQVIIVGGTGMYFHSLLYRPSFDVASNENMRRELENFDNNSLFEKLLKIDPQTKISKNDRKRMLRFLEVYAATGSVKESSGWKEKNTDFDFRLFCISPPREQLYEKINKRVDFMLEQGLEREVRSLLNKGVCESDQCYKAIGCRQMIEYFNGSVSFSEAVEKIKRETRHYAKRQLTWMRAEEGAVWLDPENAQEQILENIKCIKNSI